MNKKISILTPIRIGMVVILLVFIILLQVGNKNSNSTLNAVTDSVIKAIKVEGMEESSNRMFKKFYGLNDDEEVENAKTNQIFLDGYICKAPVYRKTPLGREIADILLAVNRPYGKSDYIPCICWGRNARFASGFEVGGHTQIWGRIQSREYVKKLDEEESERRVAYEVSVSKLEYLD